MLNLKRYEYIALMVVCGIIAAAVLVGQIVGKRYETLASTGILLMTTLIGFATKPSDADSE